MWHKLFNSDLIASGNIVRKRVSRDPYDGFKVFKVESIQNNTVKLVQTHQSNQKLHPERKVETTIDKFFCPNCCDIWSGVETIFQEEVLEQMYAH